MGDGGEATGNQRNYREPSGGAQFNHPQKEGIRREVYMSIYLVRSVVQRGQGQGSECEDKRETSTAT